MDLGLTDRVFVVTAASSGLGRRLRNSWWPREPGWCWWPAAGEVLAEAVELLWAESTRSR